MNEANGGAQAQPDSPLQMAFIGCGGMARHHLRQILQQQETTRVRMVCEPSPEAYARFCEVFEEAGVKAPENEPDLERMLTLYGDELDAAFIITPHALHHRQARACMEAGLDVLLEKPMVMNAEEALDLIDVRNRTGRLMVVAFNGSLSPRIRTAARMLRSGEIGPILNIHGVAWQSWKQGTANTWRQIPEVAGGGFLFDTGAHMLNTISDLAGEDFVEVAAWLDNRGTPVDILAAVIGRLRSGAMVTMSGCGEAIPSCASDVRIFCTGGILQTGIWGERLLLQRSGHKQLRPVRVPESLGQWQQFTLVRKGEIENPCPPEIGLRMARLWDAIRDSAAQNGQPVQVTRPVLAMAAD
jgi:predicted dehydrogenase